jgi:type I restriction enzyme S subunit
MENHGYARHYQYLEKKTLSIPEMPEHNRIFSRIEELFSDLEKAVETLQNIKQQLAVYRQAV